MKLVFVYWGYENAGSMLDLRGYVRAARGMGHEVMIYGPPHPSFALDFSMGLKNADAVVYVFEWTQHLQFGDRLDWIRLLEAVPRERRVVIDCDGGYNDPMNYQGDYNHPSPDTSRAWITNADALTDKILQPTYRPKRPNVRPFLFHIYDPKWETPLDFDNKEFGMIYLGHTKFRWHGMSKILRALEPVRDKAGRVGLVGEGWDALPKWTDQVPEARPNFYVDFEYLKKLRVEALPPVPYPQVIAQMSRGIFNPVIYRPLFEYLGMVTCRTFETMAAGTIPLFELDPVYVREIYGERAMPLVLGDNAPSEKIADVLDRPNFYGDIVREIRKDFAVTHSPEARLRELIKIIEE